MLIFPDTCHIDLNVVHLIVLYFLFARIKICLYDWFRISSVIQADCALEMLPRMIFWGVERSIVTGVLF